jgi:UDP-N-acetylmuramate dehydrogenase
VTVWDQGVIRVLDAGQMALSYRHSSMMDSGAIVLEACLRLQEGDGARELERMEDFNRQRREKQPLEYPSAGSTFKRPVGGFAAALIDQCGLKGLTVGGAQVSSKHAGFVVNLGGATCADVLKLTEQIHETVLKQTGISLELEIKRLN